MITIKEYVTPNSIEEAYKILVSKKNNVVLGGCGFLKLGSKNISTAIDLKNIKLSYVKEEDNEIRIGADTTLRDIEINEIIKNYASGVLSNALSHIVGVQFRSGVRIGASVFSKYGFSDILPVLLVLEAKVNLYNQGIVELKEFLNQEKTKDILVEVIIPKKEGVAVFESIRKCSGDFAIINASMFKDSNGKYKVSVGARPQKAMLLTDVSMILSEEKDIKKACDMLEKDILFGSNMRASSEYRCDMAKALVYRMYTKLGGVK